MSVTIKNRLTISGTPEQVKEIFDRYNTHRPVKLRIKDGLAFCKTIDDKELEFGWFDFKTSKFESRKTGIVMGLPDDWELVIQQAVNYFPNFNKIIPQPENILNTKMEGVKTSQANLLLLNEWNMKNWGVKGNCHDCFQENYNTFLFSTYNDNALNLMMELSKQNPNIKFIYDYASEGIGDDCGSIELLNGIIFDENNPIPESKEAYEFGFKLWPEYKKYYKLINNNNYKKYYERYY